MQQPPLADPPRPIPVRKPGPYAIQPEASTPDPQATTAEATSARSHFRPDIEGLRAVAVIAVVLFHVGLPGFSGGFVGVDVFYVISGFLITGLLLREGESTGKVDLIAFYARRMRRLLPAALLAIVVSLALSAVILSPLRLTEVAGDAAASALYVANFRFAFAATDYLAIEAPSPFLHFWSLGVEEQFYLFWPLILLVAVRLLSLRFVGIFIVVLAVASFALSMLWTETAPAWAFFSLPTRAWELAAGALIAVGFFRLPRRAPRVAATALVVGGLGLIVAGVAVIDAQTPFPGVAALLPVVGTVLVIVGGSRVTLPGRLLGHPAPRYVGRISYSLYLWHWPIIVLVPIALGNDELWLRVALAWVAVIVAAISTELVEQPFRTGSFLRDRPWLSVQFGLGSSVAVGVAALFFGGALSIPNPFVTPDPIVVQLAGVRADLPRNYADGCHIGFGERQPVACIYGDRDSDRTAFLFGDSHAAQWLPAIDRYARDKGLRLVMHTKAACSPVPANLWERNLRREYDECFDWREAVMRQIAQARPEVVFVGSSRDYEIWDEGTLLTTRELYPAWQRLMTTLLERLDERARRVVLLAETPFLNFDPVDCLALDRVTTCDPPRQMVVDDEYASIERSAADAAGASLLTANELLCPGRTCPVVVDDTVVFRDNHHVTATYMARLTEPITDLLEGRDPRPSAPLPTGVPRPS